MDELFFNLNELFFQIDELFQDLWTFFKDMNIFFQMDELLFFKSVNLSSFHIFIFVKNTKKNLGQHASEPAHASSAAGTGSLTGATSAV